MQNLDSPESPLLHTPSMTIDECICVVGYSVIHNYGISLIIFTFLKTTANH